MIPLLAAALALASPPPPMVGGSPSDRPEVVALGATKGNEHALFCSAVVLEPTMLLTAAHCVDEALEHDGWAPDARSGPEASEDLEPWADWVQHPGWGADPTHHADLAVVYLDHPLEDSTPVTTADLGEPEVLTLVGYGWTGDGAEDPGVQREADVAVDRWDEEHVWTWEAGANLCSADSGGAVLDPDGRLVAVSSFVWSPGGGEPMCEGGGAGAVRADAYADWVADRRAEAPQGCGCSSTSTGGAWLLLVLVLTRRRR